MVSLNCTLLNFSDKDLFLSIFEGYNNDFEYTADGVFPQNNTFSMSKMWVPDEL